jgi:hypothetical protein
MIPFTTVAMAIAPSVPMPDAVLAACAGSQLALRHHSDALLVLWSKVLWDWRGPERRAMWRWTASLPDESFLFLQTTLETARLYDQLGAWSDNPFALGYDGAIRYELNGDRVHFERMSPHPDRLIRHHVHGRMLISRSARQPETARLAFPYSASSRSYPRLPAVTTR